MRKKPTQFIVRTSSDVHERLKASAARLGLSLNDHCVHRLTVPSSLEGATEAALREALTVADGLFGAQLRGAAVYGSWARGQATAASDVDFLLVLDDAVAVDRDLYTRWDEAARGRVAPRVEVHIVHLPPASPAPTGFWAEIALDGIVVYDRGLDVSRYLGTVRRDISAGRIIRREIHGQPYWVKGEVA